MAGMGRRHFGVYYVTCVDGPIQRAGNLTHYEKLGYVPSALPGERLIVNDSTLTGCYHEVEVIDPKARTVRWIRDAGPIIIYNGPSAFGQPPGPPVPKPSKAFGDE